VALLNVFLLLLFVFFSLAPLRLA